MTLKPERTKRLTLNRSMTVPPRRPPSSSSGRLDPRPPHSGRHVSYKKAAMAPAIAMAAILSRGVQPTEDEAPPPPPNGVFVVYPNENIAFIAGPQVVSGTSPWAFFDDNAIATGHRHGAAFPPSGGMDVYLLANYYDQGRVQYINYYRTGDPAFRDHARNIADTWYAGPKIDEGRYAYNESSHTPRQVSLDGLMLRALDGRPEMWDWIYRYVNYHFGYWVERHNTTGQGSGLIGWPDGVYIVNGHRETAYVMLYAAQLAKVLPDTYPLVGGGTATDGAAKRADLRQRVESNTVNYFLAAQWPDGSWRHSSNSDNTYETMYMLFMGLWWEGLIAVHRLSDDPAIRSAIQDALVRFLTHVYTEGPYRGDAPIPSSSLTWRSVWYFYHGGTMDNPTAYENGGGSWTGAPLPYADKLREQRQLNVLLLHAFGYAYKLTGDSQFRDWGDEWFAASFGNGQGPLADASYSLADFREKEYDQAYRTAGRYLAWRAGY